MDNNTIIQIVITVFCSGTVAWFLKQQIESQKNEITTLKSSLDNLERYVKIIDIDEFEKYVAMTNKSTVMEMTDMAKQSIRQAFESQNFNKVIEETLSHQLGDKYMELLVSAADSTLIYPDNEQDEHIRQFFPHNYENLKGLLENMKMEGYDIPEFEKQNFSQIVKQLNTDG
jgi:hypothetical protein